MSGHKGGDGATPFGGFVYTDETNQVQSGTVVVHYGNGQTAQADFTVDQKTHQASVSGGEFTPANPTNVTEVEFSTDPAFPANTTSPGTDPADPTAGHFAVHAMGSTSPVGESTEFMNCCTIDRQTP